jgi:hypothetical protein
MTRDDIIKWARDAGFEFADKGYGPDVLHTDGLEYSSRCFERFAALVAAAEREACANICDSEATIEGIAQKCAAAIRARSQS